MLSDGVPGKSLEAARRSLRRVDFLGLTLTSATKAQFVDWVIERASGSEPSTSYAINASSVNLAFKNRPYWNALQNCDALYCDGISVYWASKVLGRPVPEKLTTTDCVDPIAARCATEGLSMYIIGNESGVAQQAAERLVEKHPGLIVKGTHAGFFNEREERLLMAELSRLRPDLLWVGMGNPLQELWVERHRYELRVPITLTCGAMMEIVSGRLRRPPPWVTDYGFEWAFRLLNQPRQMWRRYLIGNVVFLARVVRYALGTRLSRRRS